MLKKYAVEITEKVPHGNEVTLYLSTGPVKFSKSEKTKHVLDLTPETAHQLAGDGYKVTPVEAGKTATKKE